MTFILTEKKAADFFHPQLYLYSVITIFNLADFFLCPVPYGYISISLPGLPTLIRHSPYRISQNHLTPGSNFKLRSAFLFNLIQQKLDRYISTVLMSDPKAIQLFISGHIRRKFIHPKQRHLARNLDSQFLQRFQSTNGNLVVLHKKSIRQRMIL